MSETPEGNGNAPNWKDIGKGVVSVLIVIMLAWFADLRGDTTKNGAINSRQDQEITEVRTNVQNMRADLARIEALLIRLERKNP